MITIRRLGLEDYTAMCEVWKDSGVHYQPSGRESYASFARQMASGLQTAIGACADGQLVGVALATHDGRKGWINRLGVRPAFQRQGIGRMLVEEVERILHEQGMTIVAALVEKWNDASLSLFQSEGYKIMDAYYLTKRDTPDA
ncbi:MAG TPA: GNAT family N-acetyltransferase [Aggregatilineales bacterium]|nr:GNAT family N-acetyltransferase [Aggregatilineales bacterium]